MFNHPISQVELRVKQHAHCVAPHLHVVSSARTACRSRPKYGCTLSPGAQRRSSRCQFSSSDAGVTIRCGPGSRSIPFNTPAMAGSC